MSQQEMNQKKSDTKRYQSSDFFRNIFHFLIDKKSESNVNNQRNVEQTFLFLASCRHRTWSTIPQSGFDYSSTRIVQFQFDRKSESKVPLKT